MTEDTPPRDGLATFHMGVMARLRAYFFAGLLITAPTAITLYTAWLVIRFIDGWVTGLVPEPYNPNHYLPFNIPGLGLIAVLALLVLVGWATAGLLGRLFLRLSEGIVNRMPVVRSVYSWVKQIFETVFSQQSSMFREVVMIEFPRRGLWRVGFITGRTSGRAQETPDGALVNVFVPNTPNAATGFLTLVPENAIHRLELTTEEALKLIISGGIATPPERRL